MGFTEEVLRSHPTRVRGLKQEDPDKLVINYVSHPTRVRGLKLAETENGIREIVVAPHAGAWIETGLTSFARYARKGSHPTRVRGLKQG